MGIERISLKDFESDFWEHHYRSSLPFVLELDSQSFPCLGWSIETLGELAKDEEYILYEMPPGKFYTSRNNSIIHKLEMKVPFLEKLLYLFSRPG